MVDPLSVSGGVIGILSFGIQVTQVLVDYYSSYKHQDSNVGNAYEKLDDLLSIFQTLQQTLTSRQFRLDEQDVIKTIASPILQCERLIAELQAELLHFQQQPDHGVISAARTVGRRLIYPFRQSTLQKLDEDVGEIRANLTVALNVLQLSDSKKIQDDILDVRSLLDKVRADQVSSTIRDWLRAPDATINHSDACAKRHPGTGLWFVNSLIFSTWLTSENSFLWLNGFAGCGKSVLCSTAIQYALRHRRSDPTIGIAFFYFSFNDEAKRDESGMLRALLLQLSSQVRDGHSSLARLRTTYQSGIPPIGVLLKYLRDAILKLKDVYLTVDALDESPRYEKRDQVLEAFNIMRKWALPQLHLLVTSRREEDIRDSLQPMPHEDVLMKNPGVDKDIADFVSDHLTRDRRLSKWHSYHKQIKDSLSRGAKGVFRWVECQFKSLQSCPCSKAHLNQLLGSLPRSLDETYERMLCSIDSDRIDDARRLLVLLCFASRPLRVREAIEGLAIELSSPMRLDTDRRLETEDDLRYLCPGFVDVGPDSKDPFEITDDEELPAIVRIAHYSVQEYLESGRIANPRIAQFNLGRGIAHAEMARICLIYLLDPGIAEQRLDSTTLDEFPMAHFAAMYWDQHYTNACKPDSQLDDLALGLFAHQKDGFHNWVRLHNVEYRYETSIEFQKPAKDMASPLYYACLLGFNQVVERLIATGAAEEDVRSSRIADSVRKVADMINAQSGFCGNALQAASLRGHEQVIRLLIEKGADVNAQGGDYGNALQAASLGDHEQAIRLLIEKGADVNAQGGYHGNALQAASLRGHEQAIRLLIETGADVNTQGGYHGNALQAASLGDHEQAIRLLIEKGADVNAQGGYHGNALQAASLRDHKQVVRLLIEKGANVNAQGGRYDNALQAASFEGHEQVVRLLIEKRADVNAQGGRYGNALQAASARGHEQIVQLLIEKGTDVNAQGGAYDNALQAAKGYEQIVRLLTEKGASDGSVDKEDVCDDS